MTDPQSDRFGLRVQTVAAALTYPSIPDIAGQVSRRLRTQPARQPNPYPRRLALAGLVLVLACLAALAVPQVRATLTDIIQIGAVRIFVVAPTATATATPPPTGAPTGTPA